MTEADEFVAKFKALLKERNQVKRAIYNLSVEKTSAEQERDEFKDMATRLENKLQEVEEKLEDTKQISEARRLGEIAALSRADKAEKRGKILGSILDHVQDEIRRAALEEDGFIPAEETGVDEVTEALQDREAEAEEVNLQAPGYGVHVRPHLRRIKRYEVVKETVIGSPRAILRTALFVASGLALLMSITVRLTDAGIYIDALRGLWAPWPSDTAKLFIGLIVPIFSVAFWYWLYGRKRWSRPKATITNPPEEVEKQIEDARIDESGMTKQEEDEFTKQLQVIFGDNEEAVE